MSALVVPSESFEVKSNKDLEADESFPQSKNDENGQNRFPAVNKKRIKTLNSVSRSRFQKPQPNIKCSAKRGTSSPTHYVSNSNVKRFQDEQEVEKGQKDEAEERNSNISSHQIAKVSDSVELLVNETSYGISASSVDKNSINPENAVVVKNATDLQEFEAENILIETQCNSSSISAKRNEALLQNLCIKSPNVKKQQGAPLKTVKRTHFGKPRPNINSLNKNIRHSSNETAEKTETQMTLRDSDSPKLLGNKNEVSHIVSASSVDENFNNLNRERALENVNSVVETGSLDIQIISSNMPKHKHIIRNDALSNLKKKKGTLKTLKHTRFEKPQPNVNCLTKSAALISASVEVTKLVHASEKSKRLADGFAEQDFVSNSSGGFSIDRAAKFPHLTSILTSKKRIENKEILHKRKKYARESPPERDKMTIVDLIYWNPSGTPMQCSSNQLNTNETSMNSKCSSNQLNTSETSMNSKCSSNQLNTSETSMNSNEDVTLLESEKTTQEEEEENTLRSVPKLVVGQNGEINIDQASLIVRRHLQDAASITDACNDDETTYSTFRKRPAKQWTTKETAEFYKALTWVGTDFGLMEKFFPNRSRRELKLKFKREERLNMKFVNRAIYESQTFNIRAVEEANRNIEQLFTNNEGHIITQAVNVMASSGEKPNECLENSTSNNSDSNSVCSGDAQDLLEGLKENYQSETISNRRKRKAKVLADDFVDIDDLDIDDSGEENCQDEINSSQRKRKALPDFIDANDLRIDNDNGAVGFISDHISNQPVSIYCTVEKSSYPETDSNLRNSNLNDQDKVQCDKTNNGNLHTTLILSDENESSKCKKTDLTLQCNSSEIDMLKNVVADEIVMSGKTVKKSKKKLNVPKPVRHKKVNVLKVNSDRYPSSTNYTPVEEYPKYEEKDLQFTPQQNLKTYSHNKPEIENLCITSLDTEDYSPESEDCSGGNTFSSQNFELINFESSEPIVNVSTNTSLEIPVISDPSNTDVALGPVMIFANTPDEENILHLFMYNTNTDMQANMCSESLTLVS